MTGPCAFIESWAAIIVGLVACLVYYGGCNLFVKIGIDDPISAVSVHGVAGLWGAIAAGIFALPEYGRGIVYGGGHLLGVQLLGIVVAISWSAFNAFLVFYLIDLAIGVRANARLERIGLDSELTGYVYEKKNSNNK